MRKVVRFAGLLVLLMGFLAEASAEFLANVDQGQPAEQPTRAAAAAAFEGYQSIYAGMAQLERRQSDAAARSFAAARSSFEQAQRGYQSAAEALVGNTFDPRRIPDELNALNSFASRFGGSVTERGDALLRAFGNSFGALRQPLDRLEGERTPANFRRLQLAINEQIRVGTIISTGFRAGRN
jgi:hypothetical protein